MTATEVPSTSMSFAMAPGSPAGVELARLADGHADELRASSAAHDQAGSFMADQFASMQRSGFLGAAAPEAYGGLGIAASVDIVAAFNRLGRGDGGAAIGAHMHLVTAVGIARLVNDAARIGATAPAWLDDLLHAIGKGQALISVAGTEPGQTIGWFQTAGRPTDGGYLLSGRKAFATNSPGATHFYVMFRIPATDGGWMNAVTIVDATSEGIQVNDDWDPLGMRSSGSNSIEITRCFVPADRVLPVGRPREISRYWVRFFVEGNAGLLATYVGLAEEALRVATEQVAGRTSTVSGNPVAVRPGIQQHVAEAMIRVGTARACVERIARIIDAFYQRDTAHAAPMAEHHRLMAEFQTAKMASNRACIEAVDLAMTVAGGSGYLASSRLSQLYRDVRAGPFMQAYSPIETFEYVGKVALGLEPDLVD
jgi:alkylation response protein AidB-like acyl-CoA dehydrogenase